MEFYYCLNAGKARMTPNVLSYLLLSGTKAVAAHMAFRLLVAVARVDNRPFRRNTYMV